VPKVARATFAAVSPVNIAAWALGGFYFSLMPSVVRAATGTELPILGGLVVASLTFTATVAVVALRKLSAENMFVLGIVTLTTGVMLTLVGVESQNVGIMLFGTVVSGVGFGTVYSGTLRSLLPHALPGKRAGLLAAFFVEGYLSFSLPALAAGFLAPSYARRKIPKAGSGDVQRFSTFQPASSARRSNSGGTYLYEFSVWIVSPRVNWIQVPSAKATDAFRRLTRCISNPTLLRIPNRSVLEVVELEIGSKLPIQPVQHVLVECSSYALRVVIGRNEDVRRFDEIYPDAEPRLRT
jgi:hypothetical protein